MQDGEAKPGIKVENVRHLIGEMIVFGQRIGSGDDVTLIEEWNKLPIEMREWLLEQTKVSLPKLITDTELQASERIIKIQQVIDQLLAVESLEGETVPERPNPFADLPPANDGN